MSYISHNISLQSSDYSTMSAVEPKTYDLSKKKKKKEQI
jgi:hypothetical protein